MCILLQRRHRGFFSDFFLENRLKHEIKKRSSSLFSTFSRITVRGVCLLNSRLKYHDEHEYQNDITSIGQRRDLR